MFLELDVSGCIGLISSFDRFGTTVFNYSSLRASLLTVLRVVYAIVQLISLFQTSRKPLIAVLTASRVLHSVHNY